MWKWAEQYFIFTGGQKNAILLLIFLSAAAFIVPKVYSYFSPVQHIDNAQFEDEINSFIKEYDDKKQKALLDTSEGEVFNPYSKVELSSHFKRKQGKKIEYFEFDP